MIDYGDLRVKHINQFLICLFADEVVVLGLYSSGSITPSLNISFCTIFFAYICFSPKSINTNKRSQIQKNHIVCFHSFKVQKKGKTLGHMV